MRKNKSKPAAPAAPTSDNPGTLPLEVENPAGPRSVIDKAKDRDALEILSQFRNQLGAGGGFVTLQRRNRMFNMPEFAKLGVQVPIKDLTEEYIANTFGGGEYIAIGRSSGGKFEQDLRANFTIDPTIRPKNPLSTQEEKPERAAAVDVPAMMRETREAAKQDAAAVVDLAKAMMGQRHDQAPMMDMMKFLFDAQQKAEQRHADALRKSDERFERMISEMQNGRGADRPRSLREQLEEAKELVDLIGGKGKDEDASFWKDLGRGIAEVAIPILKEKFAGAGGPLIPGKVPPQAALPTASTSAPASTQPAIAASAETGAAISQTAEEMNPLITAALRQFRDAAIEAANEKADVFEFVRGMLRMVKSYQGQIFELANSNDWFARVFGNDQEAIKVAPYIGEIRNAILERAFVEHAKKCFAATSPAEDTAKNFLDWNTRDFDDYLLNLAEDRDNWAQAFEGAGDITAFAAAGWLESLRLAVVRQLGDAPAGATGAVIELPAVGAKAAPTAAEAHKKTK